MSESSKVAVLGGGSFGTVIANIAAENGHPTTLWMRNESTVESIQTRRINPQYLPDLTLDARLEATTDLEMALKDATTVFFAIPSKSFREVVISTKPYLSGVQVLSMTKGIEPGSLNMMSAILKEELSDCTVGVIGGPNLAKEIAKHELTATVVASEDSALRQNIQQMLSNPYFRVYASADIQGIELGGALKNIYAIMAGIVAAQGLGENTVAMVLTRSLAEMVRFAEAQGANPMTFLGLAGVGDLIATCSSPLSRNYRVGYAFGSGKDLEEAVDELGEVAEGVNTLAQIKRAADEKDIYMPLVQGLYALIYGNIPLNVVIEKLMTGEQNTDVEYTLPKDEI